MMGMAAVAFHWPPQAFWQATPHEYAAACEAHELYQGKPDGDA